MFENLAKIVKQNQAFGPGKQNLHLSMTYKIHSLTKALAETQKGVSGNFTSS